MVFPLISLKICDANRRIPGIGFNQNDEDCSDLSSFFPDIFVMQTTDTGQSNHFVIIRFFLLNWTTWYKLHITKYKLQTPIHESILAPMHF